MDKLIEKIVLDFNAKFMRPLLVFCPNKKCIPFIKDQENIVPTTWDMSHLTSEGAVFLIRNLLKIYEMKYN